MTETATPLPVAAPCEHCGSTDIFIEREDLSAYQARCNDCGSRGPIVEEGRYYDNEEAGQRDAIAAWNRRAAPSPAAAAPSAAQWLPIETAPKDGTDILLYAPAGEWEGKPTDARTTVGHWTTEEECRRQVGDCGGECRCPEYDHDDPYWLSWDGGFLPELPPTHWMPLPAAPGAQPAQGGGVSEAVDHSGEWRLWWQGSGQRGSHIMWSTPGGLSFGDEVAFLGDQHHDAADELVRAHNEALSAARAAQPVGEMVDRLPKEPTEAHLSAIWTALGWRKCENAIGEAKSIYQALRRAAIRSAGEEANG